MGTFLYTVLVALAGVLVGIGASVPFWRRQLLRLDFMWRAAFANCVNQTLAQLVGGHVENGVIYLPGHGPAPEEADVADSSKKPN